MQRLDRAEFAVVMRRLKDAEAPLPCELTSARQDVGAVTILPAKKLCRR
jgi:hypothetical protein